MTRLALACALLLGACSPEWAIGHAFGDDPHLEREALAIAECESNMTAGAVNPSSGAAGLFQLMRTYHAEAFEQVTLTPFDEGWDDPVLNAMYARALYDQSGDWRHWSCRWVAGE